MTQSLFGNGCKAPGRLQTDVTVHDTPLHHLYINDGCWAYLHLPVRVGAEASGRLDEVVIHDTKAAEIGVGGVVVLRKLKEDEESVVELIWA